MKTKTKQYKNIKGKEIYVDSKKRDINEEFEGNPKSQEIKNLVSMKYLEEVE